MDLFNKILKGLEVNCEDTWYYLLCECDNAVMVRKIRYGITNYQIYSPSGVLLREFQKKTSIGRARIFYEDIRKHGEF